MDLRSYLVGKHGGAYSASLHLPSYLMGRAKSGGIQEITGTLPLTVRSRASQVLENYIIYGESVQDGTPTPDNPVEVTGLGVRTENLFDSNATDTAKGYVSTGYLTRDGIVNTTAGSSSFSISEYIDINGYEHIILCNPGGTFAPSIALCFYDSTNDYIYGVIYNRRTNIPVDVPSGAMYVRFTVQKSNKTLAMLVQGSTAPDHYIPYGYKLPITITSNGTTTDYPVYIGDSQLMRIPDTEYADYVDYEKGKIVRMVKEYTFTGDENIIPYGVGFYTQKSFSDATYAYAITTRFSHFTARGNNTLGAMYAEAFGDDCACFRVYYTNLMLRSTSNFTTSEECKAYFKAQYDNGTPVKMWYALETPVEEDPPVPFPDIALPQATVTIDIDGNLKPQATIKGRIEQIT